MKKNSPIQNDEIDLAVLFKIIFSGKIKIIAITIFSLIIGFGYSSQLPNKYSHSILIVPSSNSEFNTIFFISELFGEKNQVDEMFFDRFTNEVMDKKEFLINIKNTEKFKENISKVNLENSEKELFKYSNLFEVIKSDKFKNSIYLNLSWHNTEEAIEILQNTINLSIINLEKSIYRELYRNLEIEKRRVTARDMERLDYLKEQSSIAKELDISEYQIDSINLSQPSDIDLSVNLNASDIAYYLRGYKAIDKEIELIQNRKYKISEFISEEIKSLQNDNINWVSYNIDQIEVKSLKKTKMILIVSIILGLMIGIFYVIFLDMSKDQARYKKTN